MPKKNNSFDRDLLVKKAQTVQSSLKRLSARLDTELLTANEQLAELKRSYLAACSAASAAIERAVTLMRMMLAPRDPDVARETFEELSAIIDKLDSLIESGSSFMSQLEIQVLPLAVKLEERVMKAVSV